MRHSLESSLRASAIVVDEPEHHSRLGIYRFGTLKGFTGKSGAFQTNVF